MFQKTKTPETTLFESPSNLLRGRALKKYDDPKAWQNQFYELVTSNIDEDVFKPLFKDGNMGRSNASISQLVAIMVMKEGNRCSDEQMFEAAMFQISYHTRNNKTRYQGLGKHLMWACARSMWMNFIRLLVFQTTACQRTLFALLWAIWRPLQGHLSQVRESPLNLLYIFVGGQQRRLELQIILAD